jgi:hypothetical protein
MTSVATATSSVENTKAKVAAAETETKARVALYNGTIVAEAISPVEDELTEAFADIEVVMQVRARKTNYARTVVVPLSPSFSEKADEIAALLGAETEALPSGEVAPRDADILVIVGQK